MRERASGGCMITPRVVLGLALITMGVLFTLDNLGVDDVWDFFWFYGWPSLFMVAGLSKLLWPGSGAGRAFGFVLFGIGAVMLLDRDRLGWLDFELWDLLPVIFVLIGASLLWRGVLGRSKAAVGESQTQVINAVAVLGGSRRTTGSDDFQGGDLVAFMGGVEVDLTQAAIQGEPAVIDAFAMWGGVEIRVPRQWGVTVQGIPLLGGFEDNTVQPETPTGRLIVKGFAIMGGVEVKN